jgi:hypothetical protein
LFVFIVLIGKNIAISLGSWKKWGLRGKRPLPIMTSSGRFSVLRKALSIREKRRKEGKIKEKDRVSRESRFYYITLRPALCALRFEWPIRPNISIRR